MQLTTVGQEVWRGAKQAQRLAEAGAGDLTVQERLRKLKLAQSLHDREADWAEIQELVGISRATYCRWKKGFRQKGFSGLKPKGKVLCEGVESTPRARGYAADLLGVPLTAKGRQSRQGGPRAPDRGPGRPGHHGCPSGSTACAPRPKALSDPRSAARHSASMASAKRKNPSW